MLRSSALGKADALSVGMYLQTLVLVLTARGLGTCVEVALAGYPDVPGPGPGSRHDRMRLSGASPARRSLLSPAITNRPSARVLRSHGRPMARGSR